MIAHALLFAFPVSYDKSKNLRPRRNIRNAMNHEIMMYGESRRLFQFIAPLPHARALLTRSSVFAFAAIAQKEGLGLDVRAAKCPHRLDSSLTIAAFVCAESRGRVQV